MRYNPDRNDPCPCGSGKKYKKCCISKEASPATGEIIPAPNVLGPSSGLYKPPSSLPHKFFVDKNGQFLNFINKVALKLEEFFPILEREVVVRSLQGFVQFLPEEDFLLVLDKAAPLLREKFSPGQVKRDKMFFCSDLNCEKQHILYWASSIGEAHFMKCVEKYKFIDILDEISAFYYTNPVLIENYISQEALAAKKIRPWLMNKMFAADAIVAFIHKIGEKTNYQLPENEIKETVQSLCQDIAPKIYGAMLDAILKTSQVIEREMLRDQEREQQKRAIEASELERFRHWQREEDKKEQFRIEELKKKNKEEKQTIRTIWKKRDQRQQLPAKISQPKIKKSKDLNPEILRRMSDGLVMSVEEIPERFLPSILRQGALRDPKNIYFESQAQLDSWRAIIENYLASEIEEILPPDQELKTLFIAGGLYSEIPETMRRRYRIYHMDYEPNRWPSPADLLRPDAVLIRSDKCSHNLFYFAKEVATFYNVPVVFDRSYAKIVEKAKISGLPWLERRRRRNPFWFRLT